MPCTYKLLLSLAVTVSLYSLVLPLNLKLDTITKRKPPGLESPLKAWWAKELTPDYYVAGRLTERQIKYASEAGFRSILSLFMYETGEGGSFGGEYLPTTAEAWAAASISGLQYTALLGSKADWASIDTVKKYGKAIQHLRRPILLHCDRGYTIAFVALMHMANQTRYNESFEPKVYSDDFYKMTAAMGLDFTHDDLKEVVSQITGEPFVVDPPRHNCEPDQWRDYWLAHPVSRNWYIGGQVRDCDVKKLEEAGFKAIVNMRMGLTHNGAPSQEPVALLNIKDGTTTYGNGTVPPRQDLKTLKDNKINNHQSSDYISEKSRINYEIENPQEFGDDIGYNQDKEKEFVSTESSLKYYHIPICKSAFNSF